MADSWFGKIVIAVVSGVIVNTIVSVLNPPSSNTSSPQEISSPTRAYCFDFTGAPRCPLLIPLVPGTPCFCPYQGTGYTGYL